MRLLNPIKLFYDTRGIELLFSDEFMCDLDFSY